MGTQAERTTRPVQLLTVDNDTWMTNKEKELRNKLEIATRHNVTSNLKFYEELVDFILDCTEERSEFLLIENFLDKKLLAEIEE